jgi:MFS family permease
MPDRAWGGAVLLLWAFFLSTGWRGLDFGYQWDEDALFGKVRWSVETGGVLMPPTYDWPGGAYLVAMAALTPDLAGSGAGSISELERSLVTALDSDRYRRRVRLVFLAIASMAIPLTALGVLWLGAQAWQAALAAALVAASWEVSYQTRWAVPDPLLLTCGAAALCALAAGRFRPSTRARAAAALVAGVATGIKYSAWPLAAVVVALAWRADGWRRAVRLGALAAAGFFVTTPGALLMPVRFMQGILFQLDHYATGHGVHTVSRGLPHLLQQIEYLALVAYSPIAGLAAAVGLLAAIGLWSQRRDAAALIAVAAFPLAFVLYLSWQRVMIVRNLLIVVPFVAALAALGAGWLMKAMPARAWRVTVGAALMLIVAINLAQVAAAADDIAGGPRDLAADTRAWMVTRGTAVATSPAVRALIGDTVQPSPAAVLVMLVNEPVCGRQLPANVRGLTSLVAGWREVNLDYYPDWAGHPHVVAVNLSRLESAIGCRP